MKVQSEISSPLKSKWVTRLTIFSDKGYYYAFNVLVLNGELRDGTLPNGSSVVSCESLVHHTLMRFDEIFSYTLKGDEISGSIFIFCIILKKCAVHQLFSLDWKTDGLWFHAFIWGLDDEENIFWD